MEFKRIEKLPTGNVGKNSEKFPTDLQMYIDIPTEVIDLDEFKNLAIERVKFLRILEVVTARNPRDQFKNQVIDEMTKQDAKLFMPLVKGYADAETRRKDFLSHFILRLSYCRSEDYRRWFLAREMEFFKLKFLNMERKEDILMFMQKNCLNYSPITDNEKQSLAAFLINSTSKHTVLDVTSFYKVPFMQVLDLVRGRRVLIRNGFAYVPHQDLVSILSSIFRTKLSLALTTCSANLPALESDERLARILRGLHTSYTGNDYTVRKDQNQVPYTAIDGLSKKSFPPCMRAMYETFKTTHHLRNTARLQFGLFLKGIGVSFEDSMRFWKEGFTQKSDIDADKFEKSYAYNIRHTYGKEGKRANYTPHSCMKIIMTGVGPGDNHGCPFRHFDAVNLRKKLGSFGLSLKDVGEISELAGQSHYQLACTRYFEVTHGCQNATGVNHPNQYFEESQTIISGKSTKSTVKKSKADEWGNDSFNVNLTDDGCAVPMDVQ